MIASSGFSSLCPPWENSSSSSKKRLGLVTWHTQTNHCDWGNRELFLNKLPLWSSPVIWENRGYWDWEPPILSEIGEPPKANKNRTEQSQGKSESMDLTLSFKSDHLIIIQDFYLWLKNLFDFLAWKQLNRNHLELQCFLTFWMLLFSFPLHFSLIWA